MTAKIVFMGTPNFAVPTLKALLKSQWEVVGVVTQPDRPKGRGRKLTPPPVKVVAQEAGINILQPKTLKTEDAFAELAALQPDVIVVAAFGQLLRKNVLELPPSGCINIHSSLLPRWRGAAPITAAIRAGDEETGVTIMQMDEGLDTGPIISQRSVPITSHHTAGTLTAQLAELGAELLIETLPAWLAGEIDPQPQDDSQATLAPRLKKKEGEIDWTRPAEEIERLVRAFDPWPGTFTRSPRGRLKILKVDVSSVISEPLLPGLVFQQDKEVYVMTGKDSIRLLTVQPAGKRAMDALSLVNGQPELLGIQLGEST